MPVLGELSCTTFMTVNDVGKMIQTGCNGDAALTKTIVHAEAVNQTALS
jgi:hypothetical protein